jgi:hypothetical protein
MLARPAGAGPGLRPLRPFEPPGVRHGDADVIGQPERATVPDDDRPASSCSSEVDVSISSRRAAAGDERVGEGADHVDGSIVGGQPLAGGLDPLLRGLRAARRPL